MGDAYASPVRMIYFGNEYLLTKDFQIEQDYHRYGREGFNGGVFKNGIIDGLTVAFHPTESSTSVTVAPGRAMDGSGRLLFLSDPQQVDLTGQLSGDNCYIVMEYGERRIDSAGKHMSEQPSVYASHSMPGGDKVLLAVIDIAGGNITGVDPAFGQLGSRRHIGAVLGSIEFPVESIAESGSDFLPPVDPTTISIVARKYLEEDPPTLEISAPRIALYGDVWMPNGFKKSMHFFAQTLAFDTSAGAPQQWNVSDPFLTDAIVTASIVPLGTDGKTPDFSTELIKIDPGFQYGFFVLCSGINLTATQSGGLQSLAGAAVTSYARADIRTVTVDGGNTSLTTGALSITVRKGENIFYYVSVWPHLPSGAGVYIGTSVFGQDAPPLIPEG